MTMMMMVMMMVVTMMMTQLTGLFHHGQLGKLQPGCAFALPAKLSRDAP
jgi:hypothetical protein